MKKQCSVCGLTFDEFRKRGRFGCANCYEAFAAEILPIISNVQGSLQHVGKSPHTDPQRLNYVQKITRLRKKLEKAIAEEHFEEAARLRDEISMIEKNYS